MPGASQPPRALNCARRSNAPAVATGACRPSRRHRRPGRPPASTRCRVPAAAPGCTFRPARAPNPAGSARAGGFCLSARQASRPGQPPQMEQTGIHQLGTSTALLLLIGFYVATFLLSLTIVRKKENVDAYMVSNSAIGFGMAAASMMATWIWAASFFASATSGYRYGISGPIHYGLWGALMILFIYPFGRRFREVAPDAHTLAEILHARHGTSSQMVMAVSNIVGSCISLMVNFSAAGALVAVLSPLSFIHGGLIAGAGVLAYTLWSVCRASVMTDFAQLVAMVVAAAVLIPMVYFNAGGSTLLEQGMVHLTAAQADLSARTAFLEQGAPYLVAVLAYAIGSQTIAQRLFAVREELIKPTFIAATVGYGAVVIGLGMLGLLALFAGVAPLDGDSNNLIPQMASQYLPP